jgi:hypothetical protein
MIVLMMEVLSKKLKASLSQKTNNVQQYQLSLLFRLDDSIRILPRQYIFI